MLTEEQKQEKAQEQPKEAPEEAKQAEAETTQPKAEEASAEDESELSEEEEQKLKLPFPTAAVVRIMKANMDNEKMIKKDVKIAMNKWLGNMCAQVSKEMNKFPYVMMHMHEFMEGKRVYEDLEGFAKEKERILAHMDAIKKDIGRLERDLGKVEEEEVITVEKKEE